MTGITYSAVYDSPDLRGSEETRPWDIHELLRRFWKPGAAVLDVGCGSCAKTAWMLPQSSSFIALDPSPHMRKAASERLGVSDKVQVIEGTSAATSLPPASVSYLLSLMAPHDMAEYSRVIAPGGLCVLEMVGELDKLALKEAFAPDADGPRGQFQHMPYPARREELHQHLARYSFETILFAEGKWESRFSRAQLETLLLNTNILRGFSPQSPSDRRSLDQFEATHAGQGFIPLVNHRYLVIARRY